MPSPIFSLQDVDPYNQGLMSNDPNVSKKAREFYEDYYGNAYARKEARNRRIAAGMSVTGGLVALIPHPAAKGIGAAMQVPDIYYDTKDFIDNPNIINGIHLGLDGLQFIPGLTNVVNDDILGIPGIIDDGYTAITGRNGLEDIVAAKKKIKSKKNK